MAPRAEFVRQLAELTDGDDWKKADLILKEYPEDPFGDGTHGENTGLYEELEATQTKLSAEYGVELTASTLRVYRATAIKWPDEMRTSSASFVAHQKLRGQDRYELMRVYLRKAKREGKKALSQRMVSRYRAEDNPNKKLPPAWEVQVEKAINSLTKRLVCGNIIVKDKEWWNAPAAHASKHLKPGELPRRVIVGRALRRMSDRLL